MASGLAGKVRRATDSDEFDLAGYDEARCNELAKSAFSEPFSLTTMPRLSFMVGGGKLVRQKYSDDLPKLFMGALAAIGFQEDSTAACEVASAGKYKFQHDTGKNLKFVHVFPRLDAAGEAAADEADGDEDGEQEQEQSPTDLLITCSIDDFQRHLLGEQLQTYAQRKKLLDELKARVEKLKVINKKFENLESVDAEEQAIFDGPAVEEVQEKVVVVQKELQNMVDEGRLTSAERSAFLQQLDSKIEVLNAELEKAEAEKKAKKAQALTAQREAMLKVKSSLKDSSPAPLPPLRHAMQIRKLNGKLTELLKLEKAGKGHHTVDDLKKLGEKPEIEEAITVLTARSRGWFEEEETFQERLQACLKAGPAPKKAAAASAWGGSRPSSSGGGSSGGFTTVSGGAKQPRAKASGSVASKNSFAALG